MKLSRLYEQCGFDCPRMLEHIEINVEPWEHQVEDLRCLLGNERYGIWNDAGTGKSLPMFASAALWAALGNRTVVTMPPKLVGQWIKEFKAKLKGIEDVVSIFDYSKLSSVKKKRVLNAWLNGEDTPPDILVVSYNNFRDLHPIKRKQNRRVKKPDGTFEIIKSARPLRNHPLKTLGYSVLQFDEAHKLKNSDSTVHKVLWKWIGETSGEFAIHLFTGSPIPNTLMDAYGMIRLVNPDAYLTKRSFERKHVVYDEFSDFKEIESFENVDLLYENLYKYGRRVTKSDVLDLPPMLPIQQDIELSAAHRKLYRQLLTERFLELPDGSVIDASEASKLRQVAMQLLTSPELYSDEKIVNELEAWLFETLETIGKHKVIIFCHYKSTVKKLARILDELNPAILFGETKDGDAQVEKFDTDPTCGVFIVNMDSGGAGLNLQVANYIIFYEPPQTPMQAHQGIARSWRGGQDKSVTVYFPRITRTVAAKRLENLLDKEEVNNAVVRDKDALLYELLETD
ncbi:TPA: hypothetical protein NGR52_004226 [Vibrio parahaemolyticus]|nr:hypothetical protein [Vibrio parahaemolyticus]